MRGPRGVGAQQQLDLLHVLLGNLLECLISDGDLIAGRVRAGVARTQDPRQRLAALVAVGQQGVKAIPALEVASRAVLLRVRSHERGVQLDRHPLGLHAKLPGVRAGLRVRCAQSIEQLRIGGDRLEHPIRRRV